MRFLIQFIFHSILLFLWSHGFCNEYSSLRMTIYDDGIMMPWIQLKSFGNASHCACVNPIYFIKVVVDVLISISFLYNPFSQYYFCCCCCSSSFPIEHWYLNIVLYLLHWITFGIKTFSLQIQLQFSRRENDEYEYLWINAYATPQSEVNVSSLAATVPTENDKFS